MVEQTENLVLTQLRDIRRELSAAMEHVATSMRATHRVYERLEQFQDAINRLSGDSAAHRQENRKSFLKMEADIVSLESQNISRHGELLNVIRDLQGLGPVVVEEIGNSFSYDPAMQTLSLAGRTLTIGRLPLNVAPVGAVPIED